MKTYSDLDIAQTIAEEVIDLLNPAFVNLHIAGSVRRGKAKVSDIELVGIPLSTTLFKQRTEKLLKAGVIIKHDYQPYRPEKSYRWGDTYRGFDYRGMLIEVFCAKPDNLGYIYWLRTGPGDGNTTVMTLLSRKQSPIRMADGAVWHVKYEGEDYRKLNQLRVPDELIFFELLNIPFVSAQRRNKEYYNWHMDNSAWQPAPLELIERLYVPDEHTQLRLF